MFTVSVVPGSLILIVCCLCLFSSPVTGSGDLRVEPDEIVVDAFFSGTGVTVRAEVFETCDAAAIMLEGGGGEMKLDRKGKVAFLWLNVAKVTVKRAPAVYLLLASEEISRLAPAEELVELGLGYDALRSRIVFESGKELSGSEFSDFITLKEHEGTYRVETADILHTAEDGTGFINGTIKIPPGITPGRYDVTFSCFEGGGLVETRSATLTVADTGLPHVMKTLAFEHGAWYGILAIVVAITAGFGIGFLFAGRRR